MKTLHLGIIIILFVIVFANIEHVIADNDASIEWHVQHVIGKFLYSDPPKPDQIFNFQYGIVNATLANLTITQQGIIAVGVNSVDQGMLELRIPRNYPSTNMNTVHPYQSVDVNGVDIYLPKYSVKTTDCFFEYSIPFSGNTIISVIPVTYPEPIPFKGNEVPSYCIKDTIYQSIPEFPLAPVVFLSSIASVIVFCRFKFGMKIRK